MKKNLQYSWLNWVPGPGHSELEALNLLMKEISPAADEITHASLNSLSSKHGFECVAICRDMETDCIVGMGTIVPKPQINRLVGCIEHVSVARKYRHLGIGTTIVEKLIVKAWDFGATRIDVSTENPGARAFYQKMDFELKKGERVLWLAR